MKVSLQQQEYHYLETRLRWAAVYLLSTPLILFGAQEFLVSVNRADLLLPIGVLMGGGLMLLGLHDIIVNNKEEIVW